MSCTITKSGATKRKADEFAPNGIVVSKVVKQPRLTLDGFLNHKVSVDMSSGIDGIAGKRSVTQRVDVTLSDEQQRVLQMVVDEGKNVFFTGSAGTGKSLLLKAIIAALKKKFAKRPDAISVTASTGMAATNIGGQTIHAWGAISPAVDDINKLERDIRCAKPALKRWRSTEVLIIDEVSMVDGYLFDRIAKLAARLRKASPRPCGGIQLVVTGDFFQLPPVTKGNKEPFFTFECESWKKCVESTVVLTKVFRQKDTRRKYRAFIYMRDEKWLEKPQDEEVVNRKVVRMYGLKSTRYRAVVDPSHNVNTPPQPSAGA